MCRFWQIFIFSIDLLAWSHCLELQHWKFNNIYELKCPEGFGSIQKAQFGSEREPVHWLVCELRSGFFDTAQSSRYRYYRLLSNSYGIICFIQMTQLNFSPDPNLLKFFLPHSPVLSYTPATLLRTSSKHWMKWNLGDVIELHPSALWQPNKLPDSCFRWRHLITI